MPFRFYRILTFPPQCGLPLVSCYRSLVMPMKFHDCAVHGVVCFVDIHLFSSLCVSHPAGVSGVTFFGRGAKRRRRSMCGKFHRRRRGGGRVALLFPPVNDIRSMLFCIFKVSASIVSTFESDSHRIVSTLSKTHDLLENSSNKLNLVYISSS